MNPLFLKSVNNKLNWTIEDENVEINVLNSTLVAKLYPFDVAEPVSFPAFIIVPRDGEMCEAVFTNAGKFAEYEAYKERVAHDDVSENNDLVTHDDVTENLELVAHEEEIENEAVLE